MKIKKIRPPFKIHGGKWYLCEWIIDNFPKNYENLIYVEPFGGAASVLLNKKPSIKEVYNDLYGPTANIFNILKSNPKQFCDIINGIQYDLKSFSEAKDVVFEYGSIESAISELILRRMSRGGMKKTFSWSERIRGGRPGDLNAWETFKTILPVICKRMEKVDVFSCNALDLLEEYLDEKGCLIYLDPPYLFETRTAKSVYDCEMENKDHEKLSELLKVAKCKILLSCYDCNLYRKCYKNWNWLCKNMPNNSGQNKTKNRRIEILIKNY